jgi:hypothetical protein
MCENNFLTKGARPRSGQDMKKKKREIAKRFLAAVLVVTAAVGVSALAMRTPTHNRNSLARPLENIQTDQAILFYADGDPSSGPGCLRYVERVPAMTGESKALTANLKLIAATL